MRMQQNHQHRFYEEAEYHFNSEKPQSKFRERLKLLCCVWHYPIIYLGYAIAILLTNLGIDFSEDDEWRCCYGYGRDYLPPDDTVAQPTLEEMRKQLEKLYQLDVEPNYKD
jgi:hypothetical protein